jgi:4,5-DOPA dioxygenase extradiol
MSDDELALLTIASAGEAASLAVPTDEHFLPLLYIAAVKHANDNMQFITDSFDLGSLSMRSVIYQQHSN